MALSSAASIGPIIQFPGLSLAGVPLDVFGFHETFQNVTIASSDITAGGWACTHGGGGAGTDTVAAFLPEVGGGILLELKSDATGVDNDGINMVKTGAMFSAVAGSTLIFETKFRMDGAATACNWAIGLLEAGQTVLLGDNEAITDVRNACFISQAGDASEIDCNSTKVAAQADERDTSAGTLVEDTFTTLRIVITNRDKVEFFQDGVSIHSTVTDLAIPDGTLTPCLAWKVTSDQKVEMEIKYVSCWQTYVQAT